MLRRKAILMLILAIVGLTCIVCTFDSASASSKTGKGNESAIIQDMLPTTEETTDTYFENTSSTTTKDMQNLVTTSESSDMDHTKEKSTTTTGTAVADVSAKTERTTITGTAVADVSAKTECMTTTGTAVADISAKTERTTIITTTVESVITDAIATKDLQQEPHEEKKQETYNENGEEIKQESNVIKDQTIETNQTELNETINEDQNEQTENEENETMQTELLETENDDYSEQINEENETMQTELLETENDDYSEQISDAIIIGDRVIEITYGPANQEHVDMYDVVQDTEYWSNDKSKYLFGHIDRSFSCLSKVNVGDTIILVNDDCACEYIVTRSEKGEITSDNTDIRSCVDDTLLISTEFEHDNIRLITCLDYFSLTARWVVIAEKIE